MNRFFPRCVAARLLSQTVEAVSEHVDVAIKRPIFVTGLVRTGTTALHRLRAPASHQRNLHMWLASTHTTARAET